MKALPRSISVRDRVASMPEKPPSRRNTRGEGSRLGHAEDRTSPGRTTPSRQETRLSAMRESGALRGPVAERLAKERGAPCPK